MKALYFNNTLYAHEAIHSIAGFVEGTNARVSYLRLLYVTPEGKQHADIQADMLVTDATAAVNGLMASLHRPIGVWHQSPQLGSMVRLTLHEWHGFSPEHPDKVVWRATCHNPTEPKEQPTTKRFFALNTTIFADTLRTQHPLRPAPHVYYSHEPTTTILDTSCAVSLDLRRSGAVPAWRP